MFRARHAQSIMCACVDQLIGKDQVAALRQAREERDIGGKTIGEIQRGLAAEEARRFFFQRSEEHTSELQSLMRNSYAVFCLTKKTNRINLLKKTKKIVTTVQHSGHNPQSNKRDISMTQ